MPQPRPEPKYRDILRLLDAEIAAGTYDGDRRLPSEAELCARFDASRPTVAKALADLVQRGVIERRAGSGTFLRQRPAARAFALLVPGLGGTEILDPVCGEIARAARRADADVVMGGTDHTPAAVEARVSELIGQGVAGAFFAPLELADDRAAINQRIADRLSRAGVAVVLLDRDLGEFPARSGHDLVAIDSVQAGYVLADHLLRAGARRPGFVARPRFPSTTDLRIAGCREAAARAGVALTVHIGDPGDPAFAAAVADACDAAICANDLTAAQLMRTCGDRGIAIPGRLRVAGFDDVPFAGLLAVPLTTMRQPWAALGDLAVRTMLQRLADNSLPPRQVLLSTELVVRASG